MHLTSVSNGRPDPKLSMNAVPLSGSRKVPSQTRGRWALQRRSLARADVALTKHFLHTQMADGSVYEGVYHEAKLGKEAAVVLRMARLVRGPAHPDVHALSPWIQACSDWPDQSQILLTRQTASFLLLFK